MKELETRIININVDEIRDKLISLGGIKVKVEDQINDLYDFEDGRLLNAKGYARIRTINDRLTNKTVYYMTTKKMLSQGRFKEMEENETIVLDKDMSEKIFISLGLKLVQSISKYRESYELMNSLIEIDINDQNFCPFPYIEIETDCEKNLEKVVTALGYSLNDTTSKTIFELIKEYNNK